MYFVCWPFYSSQALDKLSLLRETAKTTGLTQTGRQSDRKRVETIDEGMRERKEENRQRRLPLTAAPDGLKSREADRRTPVSLYSRHCWGKLLQQGLVWHSISQFYTQIMAPSLHPLPVVFTILSQLSFFPFTPSPSLSRHPPRS